VITSGPVDTRTKILKEEKLPLSQPPPAPAAAAASRPMSAAAGRLSGSRPMSATKTAATSSAGPSSATPKRPTSALASARLNNASPGKAAGGGQSPPGSKRTSLVGQGWLVRKHVESRSVTLLALPGDHGAPFVHPITLKVRKDCCCKGRKAKQTSLLKKWQHVWYSRQSCV
jgi:hypothetical protein